ncbi:L,D-transpeptidase family protein [Anaerocolumna sp. MB42-C2]|uniref:L,D-transpeptidase family protein n=1 Tax=Anaerocolumna sp. MB42-C2 TaxID=3070997 RepID=UPI0027DFAEE1|nr:L,D-transpeptidase family protein [Anaerocolumna sp. MB42-C2]WMJ89039.1 peptidoglycan binding domain-containing protein [Anaerocolumna sp. MB42-C2]
MKSIKIMVLSKKKIKRNSITVTISFLLIYLIVSLFFSNHFFFHTVINGVNVSLKAYAQTDQLFIRYINNYKLKLIEKNGDTNELKGYAINLKYNENNDISQIYHIQKATGWISSLFKYQNYDIKDLYIYDKEKLYKEIKKLKCLNRKVIEPENVRFTYSDGFYSVMEEVYGNKINREKLYKVIRNSISKGENKLDLEEKQCYENPKYTVHSSKTQETRKLLNKYVSAQITYQFGSNYEKLDGSLIKDWLNVNEDLDIIINKSEIENYIKELSKKYDTVGVTREFKTSVGKRLEIKGGLYGWKIDQDMEVKALMDNIIQGKVIAKEPIYKQKALSREGNEIGNTYVELNITRQHLWFYKDGVLIAQGSVVTGNPGKGNSTVVGVYMLNYKQKGATLKGPGYKVEVKYWMPFYGSIGIHDASWRYSFGGEIYKRRGTHGCVNAPLHLAKKIFENIEAGIPVISYEE